MADLGAIGIAIADEYEDGSRTSNPLPDVLYPPLAFDYADEEDGGGGGGTGTTFGVPVG